MALAKATPEMQRKIVFAGSSIFYFWETLAADMAPLPVINQAFAGARIASLLKAMDILIVPFKPRVVVFYCGSNDVGDGAAAEDVLGGFQKFTARVWEQLPSTAICFVSINKAPQKQDRWDCIDAANALVRTSCDTDVRLRFVDVNPVLFDEHGRPRSELFCEDGLHLRPSAYRECTRIIRPAVAGAWTATGSLSHDRSMPA
jgi:lysophospholipase L1-like esterase